jgi:hypothetical protein
MEEMGTNFSSIEEEKQKDGFGHLLKIILRFAVALDSTIIRNI